MSELQPIHRESDIIQWAEDRHIFDRATALSQMQKLLEEACELYLSVAMGDVDGIRDDIGDVDVCLDIQASFAGLSRAECKEYAWGEIKDRKGEIRSGVFVKEADLATAPPHTGTPEDRKLGRLDAVTGLVNSVSAAVKRAEQGLEKKMLKREPWRAAIGCSPAGPNDPPPEERIRKSREDEA